MYMRENYDECIEYCTNFLLNCKGSYEYQLFLKKKALCKCGSIIKLASYYQHTITNKHLAYLCRHQNSEVFDLIDIGKYKIKKIKE